MKKDSIGNDLPSPVYCGAGVPAWQVGVALSVNTFLLTVDMAMRRGRTVIYDRNTNTAAITAANGMISTVSHCQFWSEKERLDLAAKP